jgi:hypothetical protein
MATWISNFIPWISFHTQDHPEMSLEGRRSISPCVQRPGGSAQAHLQRGGRCSRIALMKRDEAIAILSAHRQGLIERFGRSVACPPRLHRAR